MHTRKQLTSGSDRSPLRGISLSEHDGTEHPDYGGIMSASADENEEVWVHTGQTLGDVEGETIDEYAKIRVVEIRTVHATQVLTAERSINQRRTSKSHASMRTHH